MSKRTYLDTDVLLAAARAWNSIHAEAMRIVDDPERVFISSIASKLEVIPVPSFNGQANEVAFYETFYDACVEMVQITTELFDDAFSEAIRCGMGGMDAVHVMAARGGRADELVTGEGPTSSFHRTDKVRIVSIQR